MIVDNQSTALLEKTTTSSSPVSDFPSSDGPSKDTNLPTTSKKKTATTTNVRLANPKEDYLMSNFDDAWKKFKANGHCYKSVSKPPSVATTPQVRPYAPPNAEVVSVPGHVTSRLSLIRPVGQRQRIVTPKVHQLCARCGWDATYLCSGCRTEWYCGRECQVN